MDTPLTIQSPLGSEEYVLNELPGFASFLPLLHIAWADELLGPSEIDFLQEKISEQTWLKPIEKQLLAHWLDPKNPPQAKQLKHWRKLIQAASEDMDDEAKANLATVGVQLAKLSGGDTHGFQGSAAFKSLETIDEIMGLPFQELIEDLIPESKRKEPVEEKKEKGFSVEAMQALLDGKQKEFKDKIRKLWSDPRMKLSVYPDKKVYREKTLEWSQLLADQGWAALAYPEAYGGENDFAKYLALFDMMGYHDISLSIKFGVQFGLFGGSVANLGTKKHHDRYLKDIGTLALPGCFAMTEADHGSNVRDIRTTATYDPSSKEFIVETPEYTAHKEYIGNAAVHGQMATVFAQLYTDGDCYGVHAFLVPIRDAQGNPVPNVRIEDSGHKLGLNGVDNGRLWFKGVRIPLDNLLDRFATVAEDGTYDSPITSESKRFFTMLGTLVGGRVAVPVAGLSAAKKSLTLAIQYANQRRQFGPPGKGEVLIMDYPTHQRRLLPYLAKAYALDFTHKYVADTYVNHEGEDTRELEALAAGLKAYSTWNTTSTIQECREACGGMGYLATHHFANLKADTEIFTTFEGDNTVLMQLAAKARLTNFQRKFSYMDFVGIIKYVGNRASRVITEKNPLVVRNTNEKHLRSREFQLDAFTYREESILTSAARRMKHRLDQGMDSYEAFLACQTHFMSLAEAYVERLVLEKFIEGIEKVEDESIKGILVKLCQLFALSTIEQHKGWYLEQGYIESNKAKAIRRLVDKLCGEVRPYSNALVEAFGIPKACLEPMGEV